jgi:hypothetical protein
MLSFINKTLYTIAPIIDVLSIEKMKRRAFHSRLLIDSSKNKKKGEKAVMEYVTPIQRISRNNQKNAVYLIS